MGEKYRNKNKNENEWFIVLFNGFYAKTNMKIKAKESPRKFHSNLKWEYFLRIKINTYGNKRKGTENKSMSCKNL